MTRRLAILVCGITLFAASPARAQLSSWTDKGFLNMSGAGGTGSTTTLTTTFKSFQVYQETATATGTQTIETGGGFFDLTIGARVWNNFGVGFDFWKGPSKTSDATVTSSIPDPVFFDKPRAISSTVSGLESSETWIAIPIFFMIPATDKIDVMIFGGPAVVSMSADVLDPNSFSMVLPESASGPQLNFGHTTLSKSSWGYQLGVDGRYMFTKMIGAGVFLRVSKATSNLRSDVSIDNGGFQMGGGLRVRF
jgi:hypothetical protein